MRRDRGAVAVRERRGLAESGRWSATAGRFSCHIPRRTGLQAQARPVRPLPWLAMAAALFEPITADLQVRLLHPGAVAPRRAHGHDAGYDLACVEDFTLWPARRRTVGTGRRDRPAAGRRGARHAALRPRLAPRHHDRQRARSRRPRLPRRAARHAPQHRRRAPRGARRRPHRPARAHPVRRPRGPRRRGPRRRARRPRRAGLRVLGPLARPVRAGAAGPRPTVAGPGPAEEKRPGRDGAALGNGARGSARRAHPPVGADQDVSPPEELL